MTIILDKMVQVIGQSLWDKSFVNKDYHFGTGGGVAFIRMGERTCHLVVDPLHLGSKPNKIASKIFVTGPWLWTQRAQSLIPQTKRIFFLLMDIRALHFVPTGAHFVYIGHPCRPNGRPWAQNVGL